MAKIKLTKGELKKQRDALFAYQRYLPILQLKKQQLQMELLRQLALLEEKEHYEDIRKNAMQVWAGLLSDFDDGIRQWVAPKQIITGVKNVAGAIMPVFERVEFPDAEYDLFLMPLWVDHGIEAARQLIAIRQEIAVISAAGQALRRQLRVTTQRVNLFEKVKIPQAEEAIRRIKVYIGDQMANAVGRSKIAKRKIEEYSAL